MAEKGLSSFFESFLGKKTLFKEKKVLQGSYRPQLIKHREEQIKQLANILAPCLRCEKPSNLFVYGKTGTGKTLSVSYTISQILEVSREKNIPVEAIYVNCKLSRIADTEYRLVAQLSRELGKAIPPTGLPTDEVYHIFNTMVDSKKIQLVIVLDEIDQLVKKAGDEIIYNLTRINNELKNSQITLVGISNDIIFTNNMDPRVKSSLGEEEIVFPTYNALQLQDILRERANKAFHENVIQEGVIEKCAAYAARDHGDARRALELLRVSAEIAERNCENTVRIEHIDLAEDKIDTDRLFEVTRTQPQQHQAVLLSILSFKSPPIFTGDVYGVYVDLCKKTGLRPLTQRRVSDVIGEFDMFGLINAKVISKGRFGRTREISLSVPLSHIPKMKTILEQGMGL